MSAQEVNPEDVISSLSIQIGRLHVELAMRDAALAAQQKRITQLENAPIDMEAPSS